MKNKIICSLLLIFASYLLISCGAKSSSQTNTTNDSVSKESGSQEVKKKEVELFETTFEMDDSWLIEQASENDASIYFQDPKPDPVYDAIGIYRMPNALIGTTNWELADQYLDLMEQEVVPYFFDGNFETVEYDKNKTPGRFITGKSKNPEYAGSCYIFMNNYNDAILIMYYHSDEGIDYSSNVQEMVDSMEFSFDGFNNEDESQKSLGFTNKYGTPTTKCAHTGCSNYIAPSGDTNCCEAHSNKCLNCGKYIDEDATYCMDCLSDAIEN